jgi:hypothetical protein
MISISLAYMKRSADSSDLCWQRIISLLSSPFVAFTRNASRNWIRVVRQKCIQAFSQPGNGPDVTSNALVKASSFAEISVIQLKQLQIKLIAFNWPPQRCRHCLTPPIKISYLNVPLLVVVKRSFFESHNQNAISRYVSSSPSHIVC